MAHLLQPPEPHLPLGFCFCYQEPEPVGEDAAPCQALCSPECFHTSNELAANSLYREICTTGLLGSSSAVPVQAVLVRVSIPAQTP